MRIFSKTISILGSIIAIWMILYGGGHSSYYEIVSGALIYLITRDISMRLNHDLDQK
jgi:hypothetical protein